ncbi:MAG: amidohydrolase [Acidimicrobiia bacterium]|nr:amidohydrolase [Acidimicrobiia bacterium]
MAELGFPMIDADNHYYEVDDAFTRYLDPAFADRACHIRRADPARPGKVYIGESKVDYWSANPSDATGEPGALLEYMKHSKRPGATTGNAVTYGGVVDARDRPDFQDRSARLATMDAQGVEAAIMLPSTEIGVEWDLQRDPAVLAANLTAFNRWLEDDWGYGTDGRLFGVPMLNLSELAYATAELERVVSAGARIVHLKPGPVQGADGVSRSPADPYFDPFWARCAEAGVAVAFHLVHYGYTELYSTLWSEKGSLPHNHFSPLQRVTCMAERVMGDTLCALVTHNLFGRFPQLVVATIENGSEWVAPLLKKMDRAARMCGPTDWPFGDIGERPSNVFKRHVKVNPYPEEDHVSLARAIGAENVLGGSDFPHPEGLAEPTDLVHQLDGLADDEVRMILRDNTAALLGLGR